MSLVINKNEPQFTYYPDYKVNCSVIAEIYDQEGDLSYNYKPFRNMQASSGELKDFETEHLNFKLTNPVVIDAQPSYDGSVNLILNDDINPPRIVNSRFTVIEDKKFKIIDRKGDNDTNIYSEERIDLDTRLFKNSNSIPYIDFHGLQEGGNLKAGNYVFYFKYVDADGNESDIISESSIISVHEGGVDDPKNISGGTLNTNCNKIIKLSISNLDTTNDYLHVYYTRSTGEDSYLKIVEYNKILEKKILSNPTVELTITGFENTSIIDKSLLNVEYNIVNTVKSQTQVQNMLFFGNVDKPTIPYKDLTDLSLRIIPGVANPNNIGVLNDSYMPIGGNSDKIEYYNMKNVYYYTGYWNNEIYRLGVVYILKDDSLSPVFNIRGCNYLGSDQKMNDNIDFYQKEIINGESVDKTDHFGNKIRNYITIPEDGFLKEGTADLENAKGVVRLTYNDDILKENGTSLNPLALTFNINDEVLTEIKKFAKGFFFVRQKRIPTILGQGLTIGVDKESYLPCLKDSSGNFVMESFIDSDRILTNDFARHLLKSSDYQNNVEFNGILSPELMMNKLVSNGLFNNSDFTLSNGFINNGSDTLSVANRSFSIPSYRNELPMSITYPKNKMVMVEDGSPLKSTGKKYFSASAGMAEEAFRVKYFSVRNKETSAKNLVRGNFTGYIGCEQTLPSHKIVNIHIPGYNQNLTKEYFNVRFNSFSSYHSISDRYDINLLVEDPTYRPSVKKDDGVNYLFTEYRGDCFINTVTVRMNRNFSDPEVPLNDEILDVNTWKNNYAIASDGSDKNTSEINRGDVNAVQLGHWVTFKVCSTFNLALRSLDYSNSDEHALLGKPRGFYPIQEKSTRSEAKMPESLLYNLGLSSTTSEKEHVELPDVPYIKNIFDTRIMYSQKHVNDAFKNGYRVFQGLQYQDITRQYGAIVKILDWQGSLLVVFENGISLLPINERALIQTETGQSVHMYGAGVLPDKETPISVDYGSRWVESIIRTPQGIYGVDTEAKKIWRFSQSGGGFEILSDLKIGKYLNDNIKFDNKDHNPIIALRNVKTHYDAFKGDVIFTFYDCTRDEHIHFNLVYNERINKWITRTSWTPLTSANINNNFITYDKERAFEIALNAYTLKISDISEGVVLSNNEQTEEVKDGLYLFGELFLKNYEYYSKYEKSYSFCDLKDNPLNFEAYEYQDSVYKLYGPKITEPIVIKVVLGLTESETNVKAPDFIDYLYLKPNGFIAFDDNNLYKHGHAALFTSTSPALPTNWYGKQEPFEFEFIVNDKFYVQKIFDNIKIISNKAEPDSIKVWVEGDGYGFDNEGIETTQIIKDIKQYGRVRGNAHYKENAWDIEIKPYLNKRKKEVRLRDKYAKIRVSYKGDKLAIITLLQTLYTISYA